MSSLADYGITIGLDMMGRWYKGLRKSGQRIDGFADAYHVSDHFSKNIRFASVIFFDTEF